MSGVTRARAKLWLVFPVVLILPACSWIGGIFGGSEVKTIQFSVRANSDANNNSPTPVELVLVRDEALLEEVAGLSAAQWFTDREQLLADNPEMLESTGVWEIVPGARATFSDLGLNMDDGKGLILFARYLSPGEHRWNIGPFESFQLHLQRNGFSVSLGAQS